MNFMLGLVVSAALLGILLAVREGEVPDWGPMAGIALASGAARGLVGFFAPTPFDLLGTLAGACVAAGLITWLLETPFRRSLVTVGIWLGILLVLSFLWGLIS